MFLRPLSLFSLAFLPYTLAINPSFPYGVEKIRGVNLGGWLVLEPWITPSLFESTKDERVIDEYTFGQYYPDAATALRKHWDTWITETDFANIAAAGLNHVRIPIGYWAYDVSGGEPYVQGQVEYLNKAIQWAENYDLKVIVDLHGAPGSQNGFDNSGQKLDFPTWHKSKSNIDRTNSVIETIAALYMNNTETVSAIAPLNEPAGFKDPAIVLVAKKYWKDSYKSIRYPANSTERSGTIEIISDAFQSADVWKDFMPSPEYEGVIMDTHIYQMFSVGEVRRTDDEHISAACNKGADLRAHTLDVVVGEWTPAATDCAKWLNGRGLGSRYDGTFQNSEFVGNCTEKTGSGAMFSESYKKFLRKYWEAQTSTYENYGQGWIQWTWKTEVADDWSYQSGLKYGWIPQDPTERAFPNVCG